MSSEGQRQPESIVKDLPSSSSSVKSLRFGIALPSSVLDVGPYHRSEPTRAPQQTDAMTAMIGDAGIVGSITVLRNSAMVWLGWGRVDATNRALSDAAATGVPTMGQLVVAFPRTKFQGAFSSAGQVSCSQLVGGDGEDQILGHQMASRLSQKLGYPVFISCSLFSEAAPKWMIGLDRITITHRAAALAERHARVLLMEQSREQSK